jgi:hypothetical protein
VFRKKKTFDKQGALLIKYGFGGSNIAILPENMGKTSRFVSDSHGNIE